MLSALVGLSLLLQAEPLQAVPPQAATTVAPQASPTAHAPGKTVRLHQGSQLEVELVNPLSSATSHEGDTFALRLATPISRDGVEVVAAGASGEGEVIDAAHAGMAGGAGKLILSARRMHLNGRLVRIRGMTLMIAGKSRVGLATGVLLTPYVGFAAGLIRGGEVDIPAGARYTVKLAEDVDLPLSPVTGDRSTPSEVKAQ
jgi:hypothetical protein